MKKKENKIYNLKRCVTCGRQRLAENVKDGICCHCSHHDSSVTNIKKVKRVMANCLLCSSLFSSNYQFGYCDTCKRFQRDLLNNPCLEEYAVGC